MTEPRTCPVAGCRATLGTTRNGNPYLMCPRHYHRLDGSTIFKLWRAYGAWQRIERQFRKAQVEAKVIAPALISARAEAIKHYIEVRDDAIRIASRGEAEQLEVAL